jgi:bilirubin oxidase
MDIDVINEYVPFNNTEIWTLNNQTPIAHPFHIHDVQFFILDINGNPPPPEMSGLNDVVLVPGGQGTVRFIATFNDVKNDSIPFMYHCHMLPHEDGGMMGQFIVSDKLGGIDSILDSDLTVYPNPSINGNFTIDISKINTITSAQIYDLQGKVVSFSSAIDNNQLMINLDVGAGVYFLSIKTNTSTHIVKLVVE